MEPTNFRNYQRDSRKTWSLIHTDHPIVYPTLGLVNEAGELCQMNSQKLKLIHL